MLKTIENVLVNKYGIYATTTAGFGGLLADAFFGKYGFIISFSLAILILLYGFRKESGIRKLYKGETIPIPIVIRIDDNTPIKTLLSSIVAEIEQEQLKFQGLLKKLEKYFNISSSMLTFKYEGDIYDNERLVSFLQIVRYELNDIQDRLENKAEFHILYLRRPAIGIVLGGMFRTDGIVVYQNNDYQNKIDKVATICSRKYKEQLKKYKHFIESKDFKNKENKKLLIVIQISSHTISINNQSFKAFQNILFIKSKGNGTISVDKESVKKEIWVEHAQEIYNMINKVKADFDEITIAHSMPEAIAVILGMGLENYWNINVFQYDDGGYKTVINLKKIKYYF